MRRPLNQPLALAVLLAGAWSATRALAGWHSDGVPICTESHPQLAPSVVSHGTQGATVVWVDRRSGSNDIFGQRVNASGVPQWTLDGVSICSALDDQSFPVALRAGSGDVVFWDDHRFLSRDIYAQRIDGNGLPVWAVDGIPLGSGAGDEIRPLAISDGSTGAVVPAGWIVCWLREGGAFTDDEIRVQHVNADASAMWTTAAAGGVSLASSGGEISTTFAMASDGSPALGVIKGAVVAWSEERGVTGPDIYARRIDNAGVPQWTADGNVVCGLSGTQGAPKIVNVGSGNVIIAWEDLRTPADQNVWAQKLNSSGVAQWTANGLPVCQASDWQGGIQLISDGAGGAIVTWVDERSLEAKVYAQRIDGNGQRLWTPADGVQLCTASGNQIYLDIVSDGAGGAIVAWTDDRVPDNLYAQRVDANGNLLWPASGVPITLADGTQELAKLALDGASGAFVAWNDHRRDVGDDNSDIYAMRILSSGVVEVPSPREPTSLRLAFVSSHPTPGEVRMMLDLPEPAFVTVEVLDVRGRRVRTLNPGSDLGIGAHLITWDGVDDAGTLTAPGVFFVRVRAGAEMLVTRVVRLS